MSALVSPAHPFQQDMAPLYISLCEQFGWEMDGHLVKVMQTANEERLKELQEVLRDAEENFGDNEVREACLARAHFYSEIGSKVTPSLLASSLYPHSC
jgi:hypothetical protein